MILVLMDTSCTYFSVTVYITETAVLIQIFSAAVKKSIRIDSLPSQWDL